MTPEQKAREAIDQRLAQAGWILQDMRQLNPMAGSGVAVAGISHQHRAG